MSQLRFRGSRWSVAGIRIGLEAPEEAALRKAVEILGVHAGLVRRWRILRRSLDARGRRKPSFVLKVGLELVEPVPDPGLPGVAPWDEPAPERFKPLGPLPGRPVVVGAGPAGLFAALRLVAYGLRPVVLERGDPIAERVRRVAAYWRRAELDPECNVAFGEGGAGAFSDGKLTYRGKDPRKAWVFEALVAAGAPPDILVEARPHLGTDRLRTVLRGLRKRLVGAGAEFRFRTRVEGLLVEGGRVAGVVTTAGVARGAAVFLAAGHGARDLLFSPAAQGVPLEAKGFAVGLRVEVEQEALDRCQYGRWAGHPRLPPAEFVVKARGAGRDVYSFCMCPGGTVIPAGTESDGLVVNGMSGSRRAGRWANAALVAAVDPADWGGSPLGGIEWQRHWERKAHHLAGPGRVPAQRVEDFVRGVPSRTLPRCSCPWEAVPVSLDRCLPGRAARALREALPALIRQVPALARGVLVGVETRTSSPVRIRRDASFQAEGLPGLYPVGEGAGHAGGIVSAAVDGARAVDAWAGDLQRAAVAEGGD